MSDWIGALIVSFAFWNAHAFAQSANTMTALEVVKKDGRMYVQRKGGDKKAERSFRSVKCYANPDDYEVTCYPIELTTKKFLLVDCFGHDAVCQSCRVTRFNANGTSDNTFGIPFATTHKDLMGNPANEIKDIHGVEITRKGEICIKGSFISPLVQWTQKQALAATSNEPGDVDGKHGTVCLTENGKFKSFAPLADPTWTRKGGRER